MQYCCILLRSVLPCSNQDVKICILSLEVAMMVVTMKWNARNFAMASILCEKCVVCCFVAGAPFLRPRLFVPQATIASEDSVPSKSHPTVSTK
jgi:hypothetical protein